MINYLYNDYNNFLEANPELKTDSYFSSYDFIRCIGFKDILLFKSGKSFCVFKNIGLNNICSYPDQGWYTWYDLGSYSATNYLSNLYDQISKWNYNDIGIQLSSDKIKLEVAQAIEPPKNSKIKINLISPCFLLNLIKTNGLKISFQEIASNLHLKEYKIINKKRNQCKRLGFTFKTISQIDGLNMIIDKFFSQHINRWGQKGIESQFENSEHKEFIHQVAKNSNSTRIFYLANKFEIGAIAICFLFKNKMYYAISSFNDKYGEYSPGLVLLSYLIEYCNNNNISEFDFGPGDFPYKRAWSNSLIERYNVELTII